VLVIFALTEGYLDELEVSEISDFEKRYLEFMRNCHPDIIKQLKEKNDITEDLDKRIKRIKRITGTRKITKAMEMIASSKIRIDQRRILEARPFIDKIEDSLTDIACYSNVRHPLLTPHKQVNKILVMGIKQVNKILVMGITADRGLCGGYNSNIIRLIERILKKISFGPPQVP